MKIIKSIFILLFVFFTNPITAQSNYSISGKVLNTKKESLPGAVITVHELHKVTVTDNNGYFEFKNVPKGKYHIHISYLGYKCFHYNIITIKNKSNFREYKMQRDDLNLEEVEVKGSSVTQRKKEAVTSIEIVNDNFINKNINSSLMKSLETLPGISSMEVGQGFSKPVIRGLSFNRVAVTENGIKQEGQQWGADHGLEIDQLGIENLEIIKGPASLIYGSDAIGGVVQILPNSIPDKNTTENEFQFIGKTLNNLYGLSVMSKYRKVNWHYYFRYTQTDFGDYKVPADSFFYNNFRLPIENKKLKNTAGTEKDIYFSTGILKPKFKSTISISNVYSKIGFFAGSHGIPDATKLFDDHDNRNIGLPYQKVNHIKIMSNSKFILSRGTVKLNLGYQENFRQEWSEFHTHYPSQEKPEINPNLEIQFALKTYSGNVKYNLVTRKSTFSTGLSTQYQQNKINGYTFLLPEYNRLSSGVFIYEKYKISEKSVINGGLRFDYGQTKIAQFYSIYAGRYKSYNFTAHFYDFSWALGTSYLLTEKLNLKANVGKSFRMPNASELSANGIHHGSFRYEVGDTSILSEYSYQLDLGLFYKSEKLTVEFSPFANYFPNFIFLSPTGSYLHPQGYEIKEGDAGQVYKYVQSEAFRAGIDFSIRYNFSDKFSIYSSGEYVYATDFTYPIPFTPPLSIHNELQYSIPKLKNVLSNLSFRINHSFSAAQNRNARNELQTPSYNLFGGSFSTNIKIYKININFAFQIQNILDTKYFNHLSFYRMIELPEAGRNYQIIVKIPINKTFNK